MGEEIKFMRPRPTPLSPEESESCTALRAEVERLTKERDEAAASRDALAQQVGFAIVCCSLAPNEAPAHDPPDALFDAVERLRYQRDDALAERRRVEFAGGHGDCPSCGATRGEPEDSVWHHAPDCALAACLRGGE